MGSAIETAVFRGGGVGLVLARGVLDGLGRTRFAPDHLGLADVGVATIAG